MASLHNLEAVESSGENRWAWPEPKKSSFIPNHQSYENCPQI